MQLMYSTAPAYRANIFLCRGFVFGTWFYQIRRMFKQIYLTHRGDRSEWTWEYWQWPHSSQLQNWSFTMRCSLMSYAAHSFEGLLFCRGFSQHILSPANKALFIYNKVKLATLVEGDLKAPFSIPTTPRCRGGCYSIPWIASLFPSSLSYSAEC